MNTITPDETHCSIGIASVLQAPYDSYVQIQLLSQTLDFQTMSVSYFYGYPPVRHSPWKSQTYSIVKLI